METRTEERPVAYVWADYLERLQEIETVATVFVDARGKDRVPAEHALRFLIKMGRAASPFTPEAEPE